MDWEGKTVKRVNHRGTKGNLVPRAGIEPAWEYYHPQDFKSDAGFCWFGKNLKKSRIARRACVTSNPLNSRKKLKCAPCLWEKDGSALKEIGLGSKPLPFPNSSPRRLALQTIVGGV